MALFTGPIENKVMTTSVLSLVGSVGAAVLNAIAAHSELLGNLPPLAQFVIIAALPPAITWLTGYVTPSTPRPDLYEYAGPAQPYLPEPPQSPPFHDEPYGPHYGEPQYREPQPTAPFNRGPRHRA